MWFVSIVIEIGLMEVEVVWRVDLFSDVIFIKLVLVVLILEILKR